MSPITAGLIASLAVMLIACAFAWHATRPEPQEPITSHRCAFDGCHAEGTVPMLGLFARNTALVCPRCAEEAEAFGWAVRA